MFLNRREFVRTATGLGLSVVGGGWQKAWSAPVAESKARGHVHVDGKPLAKVRISDGFRVTLTDDSGEFELPVGPESGPFLFVCLPAGYSADSFYVPIAKAAKEQVVFSLKPGKDQSSHSIIYLTDLHLGEGQKGVSYSKFEQTIQEINQLDPLPALCWAGGDISLQHEQGEQYVRLMSQLKIPVRNMIGNHEMFVQRPDPRSEFRSLLGPSCYSFDLGQVHYVTLDGCQINGERVTGHVSPRELHWLREDLLHVPEGMTTVIAIHIPLISNMPERCGSTSANTPGWVVSNAEEVIDLLAEFDVKLVLQGHLHENQRTNHKGIEFVESISTCGRWWHSGKDQRELGVSGEPRGYRILTVDGTRIRHRYQSSAESKVDQIGEITDRPEQFPANQSTDVIVNVFDPAADAVVSARVDDGKFHPLSLTNSAKPYHGTIPPAHHWKWTLSASQLTPGSHRLQFLVEDSDRQQTFEEVISVTNS